MLFWKGDGFGCFVEFGWVIGVFMKEFVVGSDVIVWIEVVGFDFWVVFNLIRFVDE